jgi:hypothetical protein
MKSYLYNKQINETIEKLLCVACGVASYFIEAFFFATYFIEALGHPKVLTQKLVLFLCSLIRELAKQNKVVALKLKMREKEMFS